MRSKSILSMSEPCTPWECCKLSKGRWHGQESYEKASRDRPQSRRSLLWPRPVTDRKPRIASCCRAIRQAVRLQPDYQAAWHNLAVTYANLGEIDHAVDAFREVVRIAPDSQDAQADLLKARNGSGKPPRNHSGATLRRC